MKTGVTSSVSDSSVDSWKLNTEQDTSDVCTVHSKYLPRIHTHRQMMCIYAGTSNRVTVSTHEESTLPGNEPKLSRARLETQTHNRLRTISTWTSTQTASHSFILSPRVISPMNGFTSCSTHKSPASGAAGSALQQMNCRWQLDKQGPSISPGEGFVQAIFCFLHEKRRLLRPSQRRKLQQQTFQRNFSTQAALSLVRDGRWLSN